jgi:hypothetical protein
VQQLGTKETVHRVRLVDNSADDAPPQVVYDSEHDEAWQKGEEIDVFRYVDK